MKKSNAYYVYNQCKVCKNRKERIQIITDSLKEGKITKKEAEEIKRKLIKKPTSYLVYSILKKYSSVNNRLTREDIIKKIEEDYGVKIESKDTISAAIEEIGYINYVDLKENTFDKFNESTIVKAGNTGFFLLDSEKLSLGEITFIVNAILSSVSLTKKESEEFIKKILKLGESDITFHDLLNLKENYSYNSSLIKIETNSTLDKLSLITRAKENKKDITFETGIGLINNEIDLKKEFNNKKTTITMTPYYIFSKNGKEIVIGSVANTNYDYSKPESNFNRKYLMYLCYVQNMENIQILDTSTPFKIYNKINFDIFVSKFINGQTFIKEGPFYPAQLEIIEYICLVKSIYGLKILIDFFNLPFKNQKQKKKINITEDIKNNYVIPLNEKEQNRLIKESNKYRYKIRFTTDYFKMDAFISYIKMYCFDCLIFKKSIAGPLRIIYSKEKYGKELINKYNLENERNYNLTYIDNLTKLLAIKYKIGESSDELKHYLIRNKLIEEPFINNKLKIATKYYYDNFKNKSNKEIFENLNNNQVKYLYKHLNFKELTYFELNLEFLNGLNILQNIDKNHNIDINNSFIIGEENNKLITCNLDNIWYQGITGVGKSIFISSLITDLINLDNNYKFVIYNDKGFYEYDVDKEYLFKLLIKNKEELLNFINSYQVNDQENLVLILDGVDFALVHELGFEEFNKIINKILSEKKIILILTSQGRQFLSKENSDLFNIKIIKPENKDNDIIINNEGYTYNILRFEQFR